tara:strand:+ start:1125 stop:1676 length:552 start_codon:yes stop_codon:yes gene_type:complete
MAARKATKTDSFFIRAIVNAGNSNTLGQTTIDLGAYVDALGQAVLRIHKISASVTDIYGGTITIAADESVSIRMALTTASFTADATHTAPLLSDNATIATGHYVCFNDQASASVASSVSDDFDQMDEAWTNGYLVAVDNMYLQGLASSSANEDVYVAVCLECSVEALDERAAISLALSQSQNS